MARYLYNSEIGAYMEIGGRGILIHNELGTEERAELVADDPNFEGIVVKILSTGDEVTANQTGYCKLTYIPDEDFSAKDLGVEDGIKEVVEV